MDNNLPVDKAQAVEAFKQRKIAMLDLLKEISIDNLITVSQVSGLILNTIEEIDFKLESGNLWDE